MVQPGCRDRTTCITFSREPECLLLPDLALTAISVSTAEPTAWRITSNANQLPHETQLEQNTWLEPIHCVPDRLKPRFQGGVLLVFDDQQARVDW